MEHCERCNSLVRYGYECRECAEDARIRCENFARNYDCARLAEGRAMSAGIDPCDVEAYVAFCNTAEERERYSLDRARWHNE